MFRSLASLIALPFLASATPVDFARDVLPILSDACFHCHGPDEKGREAKLRLDTKEGLYRTHEGITVVAPGNVTQSDLVIRVTSKDRDEVMPPPKANRQLKPEEIVTLKRWVEEGAPFGRHWAFDPMAKPQVPGSAGAIDFWVQNRLREEHLDFSPEADRERLLRRVAFDLTGLPPTLAEIDAFSADASPEAYEKVVDRLLASPRFGEHLASDWMDIARFADTHGYQKDATRAMWPWRDWVIKAFNDNLPFDQFVTWQLAGDLLPGATKEQKLATAFNRLHMQNEEGGIVGEEFRVAYVVDRVNTFATAFLGLTTECCRCHDHKYDPLSQRDFYSLFAFFQNVDEAGQIPYSGFVDKMPEPVLLLSTPEQEARLADLRTKIAAKEGEWTALREGAHATYVEWTKANPSPSPEIPGCVARFDFSTLEKNRVPNLVKGGSAAHASEQPKLVDARGGKAAELSGENGFTFPSLGHFHRSQPFSLSIRLKIDQHSPRSVVLHHSRAPEDAASRGYEILLENGRVSFGLHHFWPTNSIKLTTHEAIPVGTWTEVTVTYDGSSRASGARIYLDGAAAATTVVRDSLSKDLHYSGNQPDLTIGFRFRDNGLKAGAIDDFAVFNRDLTAGEVSQLAGRDVDEQPDAQFDTFLAQTYAPAREWREQLTKLRDEERRLVEPIPEIMVMRELPEPRKAFILSRGAYDSPAEEVSANTPPALPPFSAAAPRNRLGLAQWLLDPEHPLTGRVTVNRLWQMMFGRGLVETAENFGTQGAQPSHRELLDWLARDFIATGWNVKAALRQMALSRTYRQSSKASPELLARDPQNILLARGPARRLTAEMLRDQALATSGLLVEKLGGPSVKPYQPAGLWEEIAMGRPQYNQGKGDDLHRRSLYTFWKRTVPPPTMVTFDAADRSNCSVRRQSTGTPLQALALLNDVQIVEAARLLATRMTRESGSTDEERATWLFRATTGRKPSEKERAVVVQLLQEQRELFAADLTASAKLLAFGEAKATTEAPPPDLAAATIVAQALLNHDEAIMRR